MYSIDPEDEDDYDEDLDDDDNYCPACGDNCHCECGYCHCGGCDE
jgi:hypothetical protein